MPGGDERRGLLHRPLHGLPARGAPHDGYRQRVVDALKDHCNGSGGLSRFTSYFNGRWGTATNCKTSAHHALTGLEATLSAVQLRLITLAHAALPNDYALLPGSSDKLAAFEQGFANAIVARIGMESKKAETYKSNQQRYLKAARSRAAR